MGKMTTTTRSRYGKSSTASAYAAVAQPQAEQQAPKVDFEFSSHQLAFFEKLHRGGNVILNAVAGSGKTTTIVQGMQHLKNPSDALFLAFNKVIVEALKSKMPGVTCQTIHSLGFQAITKGAGRGKVEGYKSLKILDELLKFVDPELQKYLNTLSQKSAAGDVVKAFKMEVAELVGFVKNTLTDPTDFDAIVDVANHFGVTPYDGHEITWAMRVLKASDALWESARILDFDDMLWLVHRFNYTVAQYQDVVVDELQDLNKAQMNVVMGAIKPGGRFIGVGDPSQAIQGFAGADADAFDSAVKMTGAEVMPLSICYRCPTSHLELARQFVPHIAPRNNAPEGIVKSITEEQFTGEHKPTAGDLIICRTKAPLFGNAMRLIAAGIQARLRGDDISKGINLLIKRIASYIPDGAPFNSNFLPALEACREMAIAKLRNQPNNTGKIERISDQYECIQVLFEGCKGNSVDDLIETVSALFQDVSGAVWLSSIHRAKGLEANNVFILNPGRIQLNYPTMLDWQKEQERNLNYVAVTRSKKNLFMVQKLTSPAN